MPYRIVYKSCSQWQGTELEGGDTGEEYETKEEAKAAMQDILDKPDNDIMQAAIEAQGVEGWLEIQEV